MGDGTLRVSKARLLRFYWLYLNVRAWVAAAKALALHGVRHAHGDRRALVEACVARRLGVELVLHTPVEPPDALDCKL